jgi:ribosomal protein S27AE
MVVLIVLIIILIIALGWLGLSLANFFDEFKGRRGREEDDPLETFTHQKNIKTTQLGDKEEIAGINLTQKQNKWCPRCGLRLLQDNQSKEWVCINCGYGRG